MQDHTQDPSESVRTLVREGYAAIARANEAEPDEGGCCGPQGGCGVRTDATELARQIGYAPDEVALLPEGANMGLSCGNPGAIAALKPGEVVLDLGSGGGFDCFLIGPKVGARGRAIGVDMTPDMLTKARRNLAAYRTRTGLDNVEFRLGEIEHLPVADESVDVVISNCVLNLSPDKAQVWREIARVLKPGGRVAISDLALQRELPQAVRASVEALVGCVAGAVLIEQVDRQMRDAGLVNLQLTPKPEYVQTLESFEDPLYQDIAAQLPAGMKTSDYITSLDIQARKPGVRAKCC
ncbi:MAG: arsenite methyltransferase [Planctomycetes bacterium]|nr:arsenite methyltransferase [Planctomycetota bacterium]